MRPKEIADAWIEALGEGWEGVVSVGEPIQNWLLIVHASRAEEVGALFDKLGILDVEPIEEAVELDGLPLLTPLARLPGCPGLTVMAASDLQIAVWQQFLAILGIAYNQRAGQRPRIVLPGGEA